MSSRTSVSLGVSCLAVALWTGCAAGTGGPEWPPLAKKWFDRAAASYRASDFEDASLAIDNAKRIEPHREEVRLLAARVALAELDYDRALKELEGLDGSDARSIRGRVLWYAGQVDRAADELEGLVADPDVHDAWAQEVAKLARRGAGRQPFRMSGGMLSASDMPRVGGTVFVVPVELDGEAVLALVATGTPEVLVDSAGGRQPSWVSLRFGGRLEVKDVPALTKDLTGISRQVNAPIKVLLGVNLLRHVNPTLDFEGSQFVVRTFQPPPPPRATTVHLGYIRGGGMVMRTTFGAEQTGASLLVDTVMQFPIALDEGGWKKAGVSIASLKALPDGGRLKHGLVPRMLLGAFDIPKVPGIFGVPVEELEKGLDVNLDGMIGSGLLGAFRMTLADGGRTLWLEDTTLPPAGAPPMEPPAPLAPTGKPPS